LVKGCQKYWTPIVFTPFEGLLKIKRQIYLLSDTISPYKILPTLEFRINGGGSAY